MQTERFISVPEPTGKNASGNYDGSTSAILGLEATLGIAPVDRAHYS